MVSIIITYIDEVGFLREAIDAALQQTYPSFEVIAVCNGLLNESLRTEYPHIKWIHETRRGSAFGRNTGMQHASGEWIQFLDVDDLILPGKISNQLVVHATGAIVSPHLYRKVNGRQVPSKWLAEDPWVGLLNSGLGSTSSMLWNKDAILRSGGWSSEYQSHQEYELLFRLLTHGYELGFCHKTETIVRERTSGSITLLTKSLRIKEGIALRELMYKYLQDQGWDSPQRKNAFLQYLFRQLRGLFIQEPSKAVSLFNHYFSGVHFRPERNGIPLYNVFLKTFGFKTTENLMRTYRKFRDNYLTVLPKNK